MIKIRQSFNLVSSSNFLDMKIENETDSKEYDSLNSKTKSICKSKVETRNSSKIKKLKSQSEDDQKEGKGPKKIVDVIYICFGNSFFGMKIYGDMLITMDGSIRLSCAQSHVSFGYQRMIVQTVEHNKLTNCINVQLYLSDYLPSATWEQVINVANKISLGQVFSVLFQGLNYRIEQSQKEMDEYQVSIQFQEQKDEEFQEFISYCFGQLKSLSSNSDSDQSSCDYNSSLQQYSYSEEQEFYDLIYKKIHEINPSVQKLLCTECTSQNTPSFFKSSLGMFTYNIGRLNWKNKDVQILHNGYSIGYLELIGLDKESLTIFALRQKRMDLISDIQEISNYSAHGLFNRIIGNQQSEYISNIVTFDGFPLKIKQKTTKLQLPNQFKSKLKWKFEYLFQIIDIDVDLIDLQNLIKYRQQLVNKQHQLSMDNFIKKELSYKFEDVEYSIHSESFMHKYYHENLIALKELESYKQSSMSKCQYKQLNQVQQFNPIQILSNS